MMDNNIFLNLLIDATKEDKVVWKLYNLPNTRLKDDSKDFDVFVTENNGQKIAIQKYLQTVTDEFSEQEYKEIKCCIVICDDQYDPLYTIYENDFDLDAYKLTRLYRIVERKAKKIDDKLSEFIEGLK